MQFYIALRRFTNGKMQGSLMMTKVTGGMLSRDLESGLIESPGGKGWG